MYAYEKKDPYTFSFTSADELRLYIENNGLDIPFSDDLSPLAAKKELRTRGGHITLQNSLTVHPMEGFDGEPDGTPWGRSEYDSPDIDSRVIFSGGAAPGDMVRVRIDSVDDGELIGEQI